MSRHQPCIFSLFQKESFLPFYVFSLLLPLNNHHKAWIRSLFFGFNKRNNIFSIYARIYWFSSMCNMAENAPFLLTPWLLRTLELRILRHGIRASCSLWNQGLSLWFEGIAVKRGQKSHKNISPAVLTASPPDYRSSRRSKTRIHKEMRYGNTDRRTDEQILL